MSRKLYVGGLPFETTDDELKSLFQSHGEIESVKIITDQMSGRSKGFGFVEMQTDEGAEAAIAALHDSQLGGRTIKVQEARPKKSFGGGGGGGFRRGGGGGGGGFRRGGGGGGGGYGNRDRNREGGNNRW
ncbi:MAG: RNA-binding protein [Deltaproteobacteria bacterium]|nr:RNA-binding protein [Deltaproteobacteria bacterium]